MDQQNNSSLQEESKVSEEIVLEESNTEKINVEDSSKPQKEIENNSEVFTNTESEVITVVAQENNGELYIYDRNDENGVHNENISEFIQVCDSNNAFEEMNSSQTEEVINIDVIDEEDKDDQKKGTEDCKSKEINGKDKIEQNEEIKEIKEVTNVSSLSDKVSENPDGNPLKNYKNVILEDWEVEVPQNSENQDSENLTEAIVVEQEPQTIQIVNTQEVVTSKNENCAAAEISSAEENNSTNNEKPKEQNSVEINKKENSTVTLEHEILKLMSDKKVDTLKYSNSIVTKEDIVEILDKSAERVVRPIVTGKDLFFSIELTKKLNQKLSLNRSLKRNLDNAEKHNVGSENEPCNNNNVVDDRQKIVDILEADEVKDWKSVPGKSNSNSKENGNDMEISSAIKNMEKDDSNVKSPVKTPKRTPGKKFRTMDKELERSIALQQLREEFPSTRKRSRTTKKVNHIPFLASTVLEKALTSPEVSTALKPGPPRRRPCYLPENSSNSKANENASVEKNHSDKVHNVGNKIRKSKSRIDADPAGNKKRSETKSKNNSEVDMDLFSSNSPAAVVRTYTVKRKSTDAENEIKSTLEAVTKALIETKEETIEFKPKKQKTVLNPENPPKNKVLVKKKRKLKVGTGIEKKRNSELEKLLGDEGAVRMLYDTQHEGSSSSTPKKSKLKTTTGLKKDLMLKTKLVKNAVMRLSGVGIEGVSLRGKRRFIKSESDVQESVPLFSSTPNIVLYKPKKKQRAEASRILYRHSSSESFDSSEGYRRTSIDADGLNVSSKESPVVKTDRTEDLNSTTTDAEKTPRKRVLIVRKRLKSFQNTKRLAQNREGKLPKVKGNAKGPATDALPTSSAKLNFSIVPVRKSSRPRMISKKYSIWSSTSMDSLSTESLGLKKIKKASTEIGKKLNCKELSVLQYESLVQVVLSPVSTMLKNSLNLEILRELKEVITFLSEEESCKVVLLTSTGSTFCQGLDLNQIVSVKENERKTVVSQLLKTVREFITCLTDFKKPLIAGVHAGAIGLGVTILPYCDLVISSDKASFYTPYVKLGQAPEGAPTHTFPRISRQLVSELLFKNHKMTAADALKHGLVTQVIPEERFEEELMLISRNMAAKPIQGIQSIKFLLRSSEQEEIAETLRLEEEMLEKQWNSSGCLNNMIKFLNSGELQLKHFENT